MKYRFILITALTAALLCGCTEENEAEITETTTETSATTFNEYILTRSWDGNELLASIFYCGEYHPLPMNIEDFPDFSLSGGLLHFPDNSCAEAATDADGRVVSLKFTYLSAPLDFSVYGIGFDARLTDIQDKIGFANYVSGDEKSTITFTYEGGGITRLSFEFTEEKLTSVYISA